jgi:hypothetical protein
MSTCCNRMFHAFISRLHIFYLDVAKVDLVLHMLQLLYTYVTSVCFSCLKCMLQVFHLDVAYVAVAIHVCCKCVFQMFQLFHLDVACFYLDVAYVQWLYTCCKCMF